MKANPNIELPSPTSGLFKPLNTSKKFTLPILILALLVTVHLYLRNFPQLRVLGFWTLAGNETHDEKNECDVFKGSWVFDDAKEAYYTNETECVIDDRQNCMKFGRPDTEFLKWKWKPDGCELPDFDAAEFLEIVRGKSMAFVGDSVGRNQMQSLVCMLARVASPIDVSNNSDLRFMRWLYPTHNFTLEEYWSPLLIKTRDPNPEGFSHNSLMNLYLDEPDEAWSAHINDTDIVILSAGQWFFRPFMYYEKGEVVGCHFCNQENITSLAIYYAYQMAFRTAFTTILNLPNYKGLTFLRTFSPQHFENGGNCVRTRPFTKEEMKLDGYRFQMYSTQVEEFKTAEREGEKRGLKLRLLDTSEAMIMRPDGHPNQYGHPPSDNRTFADCVHWCMPGPVDTWNEFLLQMLKMEEGSIERELQKNTW